MENKNFISTSENHEWDLGEGRRRNRNEVRSQVFSGDKGAGGQVGDSTGCPGDEDTGCQPASSWWLSLKDTGWQPGLIMMIFTTTTLPLSVWFTFPPSWRSHQRSKILADTKMWTAAMDREGIKQLAARCHLALCDFSIQRFFSSWARDCCILYLLPGAKTRPVILARSANTSLMRAPGATNGQGRMTRERERLPSFIG